MTLDWWSFIAGAGFVIVSEALGLLTIFAYFVVKGMRKGERK